MRMLSKLLAGSAAAAAAVALMAGPALADPPSGVTPKAGDVVGVGSDTSQFLLDQMSLSYNGSHTPKLYSWDAVPQGQTITTKAGATATQCQTIRPTGSSAGIAELQKNTLDTASGSTGFCVDYARSSRARGSTDPACATGGICFVNLAGDAVTWATRSAAFGGTNAPANLSTAQLKAIYLCTVTNWNQVGGKSGTIKPFIPQTGSGTAKFFLTALGGGTAITPGPCVSNSSNTLIENEGNAPELNDPNAVFPYSVADYLAQGYHSAKCTAANCGYPAAPTCTPAGSENKFGCNQTGVLQLNTLNGTNPAAPWPLPAQPTPPAVNNTVHINAGFTAPFTRIIYDVVRFASTPDKIPSYLDGIFGKTGYTCSTAGKNIIKAYGFLTISSCGTAS
jgi:ABC-type phosphate transport system substrate-binding protein